MKLQNLVCAPVARLWLAALVVLAPATAARGDDQPNIILIFTDDQGYNDLGCFGSPDIETPHIDRMAAEGVRLTSFYAQPACGLSRAALMTGCYPMRLAEPGNRKNAHTILHPEEITLAGDAAGGRLSHRNARQVAPRRKRRRGGGADRRRAGPVSAP